MLKEISHYWQRVLQGTAHWVSYKKQYYAGNLLTEGAIVAEIAQLIATFLPDNEKFECEKMYQELDVFIEDQTRIDIVIGKWKKVDGKKVLINNHIHSAIELKRYENNWDFIQNDFEKLWRLKRKLKNIRLFVVLVGQGKLPKKLFSDSFNIKRNNIVVSLNTLNSEYCKIK